MNDFPLLWDKIQFKSILETMNEHYPLIIEKVLSREDAVLNSRYQYDCIEDLPKYFCKVLKHIIEACGADLDLLTILFNFSSAVEMITVSNGVNIRYGQATLLHVAAFLGDLEAVKLLLQYGVEMNKKAYKGGEKYTELDLAGFWLHKNLIDFLLHRGAKGNYINLLCSAAYFGSCEIIQLLLDTKQITDLSILGSVAAFGRHNLPFNWAIKGALERHYVSQENKKENQKKNIDCIILLLRYGISYNAYYEINDITKYVSTPLHMIAEDRGMLYQYKASLIRLLIASGISRNIINHAKNLPEQIAPWMTPIFDKTEEILSKSVERWGLYKHSLQREWYLLGRDQLGYIMASQIFHAEKGVFKSCPPEIAIQILGYCVEYPLNEHLFSIERFQSILAEEGQSDIRQTSSL